MKITSSVGSVGTGPENGRPKAVSGNARPAATSSDQVALSSLSAQLQEMEATVGSAPVADPARVAEIKQAIASGRFQVNPERIADGLLENVRQMLANR